MSLSDKPLTYDLKGAISENRLLGLWRLLEEHRAAYMFATSFLGLAAALNVATSLLLRYYVDSVLSLPDYGTSLLVPGPFTGTILPRGSIFLILPAIALGFLLLAAFNGLFTFLSGKLTASSAESIAERLRNYLFDHVQRLSFAYHDKMATGELIERCTSDVDAVRRFFAEQAIGIGRIMLLFVVNFVALLSLHWQLAVLSVVVVPIIVVMSLFFFRKVSATYEEFQEQEARLSTVLQENLSGVRVVKAFARQDYETDKFETENKEKYRLGRKFMKLHASFWPVTDVMTAFQLVFGYFIAATLAIQGTITVGTYLAYSGMIIQVIFPIRNLGRLIVQVSTGFVSYDRVMEVVKQDRVYLGRDATPPVPAIKGEIEFEDVQFEYEAGEPVLTDVSFHCAAGQTVALLGSTGSGKTSLVSLLPRFYDYASGSVRLDGIELREFPRYFLRANIGIVEQEPFLFSRTVRENIAYGVGRDVSEEEVVEAARAAAIHDSIVTFPDGYNTLVGERGVTLSGGQKQRVALARTLLKNPRILILDDATSSVDTETEAAIRDALDNLMVGRTTFIIAHRIQSLMNADLILVFDKGHIVQRGTHATLMPDERGIYRRIYDMQARIEDELEKEMAGVTI